MINKMINTIDFIDNLGITMTAEGADCNPSMPDFDADHWRCVLKRGRKRMTVIFSQGYGHHGKEPQAGPVLDTLAMDASGYENSRDFNWWCSEYGYNPDSKKAERIYNAVKRQATKLQNFLGEDDYYLLLHGVERL